MKRLSAKACLLAVLTTAALGFASIPQANAVPKAAENESAAVTSGPHVAPPKNRTKAPVAKAGTKRKTTAHASRTAKSSRAKKTGAHAKKVAARKKR